MLLIFFESMNQTTLLTIGDGEDYSVDIVDNGLEAQRSGTGSGGGSSSGVSDLDTKRPLTPSGEEGEASGEPEPKRRRVDADSSSEQHDDEGDGDSDSGADDPPIATVSRSHGNGNPHPFDSLPDGRTTHSSLQCSYRAKARTFFSDVENYKALERFVLHRDGDTVYSVFVYFIMRYSKGKLFPTRHADDRDAGPRHVHCPYHDYTVAVNKYQKLFYNFEDKVGSGKLVWGNIVNPRVLACPEHGPISLPLAKLVALQWAISLGFDELFWKDYDKYFNLYTKFSETTRARYVGTHKEKRRALRNEAEAIVRERIQEEAKTKAEKLGDKPKQKGRKKRMTKRRPIQFTRRQRAEIAELIQERDLANKAKQRRERAARKKTRSNKSGLKGSAGSIVLNGLAPTCTAMSEPVLPEFV